jgi:putative FmdB family regulatory protein
MPIYAYRCESCGFTRDVLQKISDAPLTQCSSCGRPTFKKQLTAAGFQLKGTGWYATDFRGGNGTSGTSSTSATSAAAVDTHAASAPAAESKPAASGTAPTT